MSEVSELHAREPDEYEELIAQILALHPDRLIRRQGGQIVSRRTTRLASQAFAERLAKAGVVSGPGGRQGGRSGPPRPRRMMASAAASLPATVVAELGLDLAKAPRHLQPDRAIVRLGYDLKAADAVLDLMRRTGVQSGNSGRYLQFGSRCGHAIRALMLALPGSEWLGMDDSAEAVAWASRNIPGPRFVVKPAQLPLVEPDGSFDGVVALDLAQTDGLDGARPWLAELWRLVKPGGFLVIAAPSYGLLAQRAVDRIVPADILTTVFKELTATGESALAADGEHYRLFTESAIVERLGEQCWQVREAVPGGGPDTIDIYLAERREVPVCLAQTALVPPASDDFDAVEGDGDGIGSALSDHQAHEPSDKRLRFGLHRSAERESRRFVVLAMKRTGSNMIVSILNTHPGIFCHGELLRRQSVATAAGLRAVNHIDPAFRSEEYRHQYPEEFLKQIYGLRYDAELVGFKLLLPQNPKMRDLLIDDPRYAKILLCRDNVLARYSSDKTARETRLGKIEKGAKITFVEREFRRFHRNHDELYDQARQRLKASGLPFLDISYVEACTREGVRRILGAIDADVSIDLGVRTQKRSSSDIVSRFSNPSEVEAFLAREQLEHWQKEEVG